MYPMSATKLLGSKRTGKMTRMIGHGTAHPAALPLGPAFHLLRGQVKGIGGRTADEGAAAVHPCAPRASGESSAGTRLRKHSRSSFVSTVLSSA
jgi:hypothetical protein